MLVDHPLDTASVRLGQHRLQREVALAEFDRLPRHAVDVLRVDQPDPVRVALQQVDRVRPGRDRPAEVEFDPHPLAALAERLESRFGPGFGTQIGELVVVVVVVKREPLVARPIGERVEARCGVCDRVLRGERLLREVRHHEVATADRSVRLDRPLEPVLQVVDRDVCPGDREVGLRERIRDRFGIGEPGELDARVARAGDRGQDLRRWGVDRPERVEVDRRSHGASTPARWIPLSIDNHYSDAERVSVMTRVTVWNEFRHEREDDRVREQYPEGIHGAIGEVLTAAGFDVGTATLDEPDHGLSEARLRETDVLLWWGHAAHDEVRDDVVDRVVERVLDGMGFLALHSAHYSKPFKRLMGTSCSLTWREAGERERLWVVEPSHPIAAGLPESFTVPSAEMYGERFDVPAPDDLVFLSWFEGGEVFRSGCCYRRGAGRVFYFRPGHETYPIYRQPEIGRVLENAVRWAVPENGAGQTFGNRTEPLEDVSTE